MRPVLGAIGLATVLALGAPGQARAHPLGFAVVRVQETAPGEADAVVRVSGTESEPGRIALVWPSSCTETSLRDAMHDEVRERRSRVRCAAPLSGTRVRIEGPPRGLEVLVDATLVGRGPSRRVVHALPADVPLGGGEGLADVVAAHARLGAQHFALGLDHVLFVLGAFFLARRRGTRAVIVAVTAFTAGHALTLAAAVGLGLTLGSRPVEACIALSLLHVARELRLVPPPGAPVRAPHEETLTRTTPAVACFLFGLVHGAGLSSALADAGLVGGDLAIAVGAFNVGLELAEIALVLGLALLVRGPTLGPAERLAPWIVGSVGGWLLLDRLL